MEGLHHAAETAEEDDARKEEGNGAGPDGVVEVGVVVLREEGEGGIYGVAGCEDGSRFAAGVGEVEEGAAAEGQGGGADAEEAEGGEEGACEVEGAAAEGLGGVLLVVAGLEGRV